MTFVLQISLLYYICLSKTAEGKRVKISCGFLSAFTPGATMFSN